MLNHVGVWGFQLLILNAGHIISLIRIKNVSFGFGYSLLESSLLVMTLDKPSSGWMFTWFNLAYIYILSYFRCLKFEFFFGYPHSWMLGHFGNWVGLKGFWSMRWSVGGWTNYISKLELFGGRVFQETKKDMRGDSNRDLLYTLAGGHQHPLKGSFFHRKAIAFEYLQFFLVKASTFHHGNLRLSNTTVTPGKSGRLRGGLRGQWWLIPY